MKPFSCDLYFVTLIIVTLKYQLHRDLLFLCLLSLLIYCSIISFELYVGSYDQRLFFSARIILAINWPYG